MEHTEPYFGVNVACFQFLDCTILQMMPNYHTAHCMFRLLVLGRLYDPLSGTMLDDSQSSGIIGSYLQVTRVIAVHVRSLYRTIIVVVCACVYVCMLERALVL